jgi:hypothetical protein
MSGGAFPAARVFPAVGLPSPFVLLAYRVLLPALCRGTRCAGAPPFEWLPPLPGRPGEFHPEPPTDPDVNLSIHPARATQRRLPPSIKTGGSSGCPLTPS